MPTAGGRNRQLYMATLKLVNSCPPTTVFSFFIILSTFLLPSTLNKTQTWPNTMETHTIRITIISINYLMKARAMHAEKNFQCPSTKTVNAKVIQPPSYISYRRHSSTSVSSISLFTAKQRILTSTLSIIPNLVQN